MDDIVSLCGDLPVARFAPGDELMSEGSRSDVIHVLESGTVGVTVGGVLVKRINDPGVFLGEISALLDIPHTASVTAVTECRTRTMPLTATGNPDLVLGMARLLAARLHAMTGYLADLRQQYGDSDTHLGLMAEVLSELVSVRPSTVSLGSERTDVPDY